MSVRNYENGKHKNGSRRGKKARGSQWQRFQSEDKESHPVGGSVGRKRTLKELKEPAILLARAEGEALKWVGSEWVGK